MIIIMRLFVDLFFKFPLHFICLFILVCLQALMNAISVIAIAPITDILIGRVAENASAITKFFESFLLVININLSLFTAFIFFGAVSFLNGLTIVATQYSVLRIKYDVLLHLLTDTLQKFFNARFLFFSQGDMGTLLNTFQQETGKIGDTFGNIAQFLTNFLQAIIFLFVPLSLSPKMTIIFIITAAVVSSPLWFLRKITYYLGKRNTETANKQAGILCETFAAAKLTLSYGRQRDAVKRYKEAFIDHANVSVKFQTLQRGIGMFFLPIGVIAVLIALYSAHLDSIPLNEMIMVLFAFIRLMPIISQLLQGKTNIEGFVPAYEQLSHLRAVAKSMEEPQCGLEYKDLKDSVVFENVSFSYPDRSPALEGLNLQIPRRMILALVGPSGAGKTTTIDLFLGLFQNQKGRILIDGIPLEDYNLNTLRTRVGYVPQDSTFFNASIRDNLIWSMPGATDEDILDSCRIANAEIFINALPKKLNTIIGDNGVRLSGGQKQRLALARAILRNPSILILDEATSALDTESERLIQQSIEILSRKMTIIMIAHRLSTIKNADIIYVFQQGCIAEKGSFDQLARNPDSILYRMIANQTLK